MSNKIIIAAIACLFSANVIAADSIMFQNREAENKVLQNVAGDEGKKENYCNDLKNKIAQLKGKPLRRTELKSRYQEECLGQRRGIE